MVSSHSGSEVEDGHLLGADRLAFWVLEHLDELILEDFRVLLTVVAELSHVSSLERLVVVAELHDEVLTEDALHGLVNAVDALALTIVGRDGQALIIDWHLFELVLVDFRLDHLSIIVLNGLWRLLGDADSNDGTDRFIWRLSFLSFLRFFAFFRLFFCVDFNSWHACHLVSLESNLGLNESLHLLGADLVDLGVESVQIPETFESQVKHARLQSKVFLVITDHVQDVTAGFLTDKITQGTVIGFLHSADLVQLQWHLQVFEHVFKFGVHLN